MKEYIFFVFNYLYFTQAPKIKGASVFCKCEKVIGNRIDQYSQQHFLSRSNGNLRICKVNNSQQFLFPELTFILLWHFSFSNGDTAILATIFTIAMTDI